MLDIEHFEKRIRKRHHKLQDHSEQIGRMCVLWSGLEFDIALFLSTLTKIGNKTIKNVLIGSLDMRGKIQALKTIGFDQQPNEKWFGDLDTLIGTINNELRNERNRMVHDFWITYLDDAGEEEINRVNLKASINRAQGSGDKSLQLSDTRPVSSEDVSTLCEKIIQANAQLNSLRYAYELSPWQGKSR